MNLQFGIAIIVDGEVRIVHGNRFLKEEHMHILHVFKFWKMTFCRPRSDKECLFIAHKQAGQVFLMVSTIQLKQPQPLFNQYHQPQPL